MKYLVLKLFSNLKKIYLKLLVFLFAYLFLMYFLKNEYDFDLALTMKVLYGNTSMKEMDLLDVLYKLLKIGLIFYFYYQFYIQDILYSKYNIFTRMSFRSWYVYKLIFSLILSIAICLINTLLICLCSNNFTFIYYLKDLLLLFNLSMVIGLIVINRYRYSDIFYILIFIVLNIIYFTNGFVNTNLIIGIILLILIIYNCYKIQSRKINFN